MKTYQLLLACAISFAAGAAGEDNPIDNGKTVELAVEDAAPAFDDQNKPILNAEEKPLTLKREVTAARWTFIIGMDGKILYKNTKVNPALDSKQVAAFITDLQNK